MSDKAGIQSSPLCPPTQTNHLIPESAFYCTQILEKVLTMLCWKPITLIRFCLWTAYRRERSHSRRSCAVVLFYDMSLRTPGTNAGAYVRDRRQQARCWETFIACQYKTDERLRHKSVQLDNCVGQVSETKLRKTSLSSYFKLKHFDFYLKNVTMVYYRLY